MLLFAPLEAQPAVRAALSGLLEVPFRFESVGSHVVFYDRPDVPLPAR
jgi:hypothetical protein